MDGWVKARTYGGNITVNVNYKIVSDFDLNQEETKQWDYSRGTARRYILGSGSIGSGKHWIKLNTINGNIYLKERN